jgi:hypothetical protein
MTDLTQHEWPLSLITSGPYRERGGHKGPVPKLEFERGNAETEASETDHREGPTIDPEADIRAGPIRTGDLGTAADQQDLGCHLPSAGATAKTRRSKGSKLGSDAILVKLRLFCAD